MLSKAMFGKSLLVAEWRFLLGSLSSSWDGGGRYMP